MLEFVSRHDSIITCAAFGIFVNAAKMLCVKAIIIQVVKWANPKPAVNTCFLIGCALLTPPCCSI